MIKIESDFDMDALQSIKAFLKGELPVDVYKVVTEIEYYTSEDSFSIQGDCFDEEGKFLRYMQYNTGLEFALQPFVIAWHTHSLLSNRKWNKAKITAYKDDEDDVLSGWDDSLR